MNDCLCQSAAACGDIWKHIHSARRGDCDKGRVVIYILSQALKMNPRHTLVFSLSHVLDQNQIKILFVFLTYRS